MQTIDVSQANQRLPELIKQTISGDEVVITQAGKPIVKLVAINEPSRKQRLFGSAKGLINMMNDFDEPLEDFKAYT
jgi:prevent-host-death family protein